MQNLYTISVETGYQLLSKISPFSAWSHFQIIQKNQWLPFEQLSAIRWEKLKKLLTFCHEHIPFYKKLWEEHSVDPRSFTSVQDMVNLPIVTKDLLTEARISGKFLIDRVGKYEMSTTSGTTGTSFKVPFTFSDFQKKYANHLRQVYASGWRLGMKSATLHYSGHSQFKGKYDNRTTAREPYFRLRETALKLAHRRLVLTPYFEKATGNETLVEQWYRQLIRYAPYMFEIMDVNILMLKEYIEKNALPPLNIPKTFLLATLNPNLKKSIEKLFNTEIFDRYSPHEIEGVAFSCSTHQGMHMAIDSYHIEFLDEHNKSLNPQETGYIVITDLDNYLMPLIRYKIGDLGHYFEGMCPCGRGLPLMGEIDGRAHDQLVLTNGKKIPPVKIISSLQDEPALHLFQIIQHTVNRIIINIIPHYTGFSSATPEKVKSKVEKLLGTEEKISVNVVDSIELEPNGKCSFVKRFDKNRDH